jgi:hypothetical protein
VYLQVLEVEATGNETCPEGAYVARPNEVYFRCVGGCADTANAGGQGHLVAGAAAAAASSISSSVDVHVRERVASGSCGDGVACTQRAERKEQGHLRMLARLTDHHKLAMPVTPCPYNVPLLWHAVLWRADPAGL